MAKAAVAIALAVEERRELEGLSRRRKTAQGLARRAWIVDTVNENPRPFNWTKSADDILAAIQRFCLRTLKTAEEQTKISQTSESGH